MKKAIKRESKPESKPVPVTVVEERSPLFSTTESNMPQMWHDGLTVVEIRLVATTGKWGFYTSLNDSFVEMARTDPAVMQMFLEITKDLYPTVQEALGIQ